MAVNRTFDPVAEAQNGFSLLLKNWILAVPTAIVSLLETILMVVVLASMVAAVMTGGLGSGGLAAGIGAFGGVAGLLLLVVLLLGIIAHAAVMSAARDAWNGRQPDIGAGIAHGLSCFGNLLIAGIVICLMMIVATIIPVLGWLVVGFLMMYTFPAIVLGGEGAMAAIGSSYRLVTTNFAPTLIGYLAVVIVVVIGSILNRIFLGVFGLNFIVGLVIGGFTFAYAAIILGRFYTLLTSGAAASPAASPSPPPMAPPSPS